MKNKEWRYATPRKQKKTPWLGIVAAAAVLALIVGIGYAIFRDVPTPSQLEQMQWTEGPATEPTTEPTEDTTQPTEPIETITPIEEVRTVEELVAEYQIAPAKAELVLGALKQHPEYTIEELIATDIEILNLYGGRIEAEQYQIDTLQATSIAVEHASVPEMWNRICEISNRVYEISFSYKEFTYNYSVDADTGKILRSDRTENPNAQEQMAAVDATLKFFEDFTPVTLLGEERDLTPHLVATDAEIWANALYFLPVGSARYHYDEFWLTNQRDYILKYAQYWKEKRSDIAYENVQIECSVNDVKIWGNFAQICLIEGFSFNYEDQNIDSYLSGVYEVMLTNIDGTWKVFDLASDVGGEPVKYPDGLPQPPLVTEAYSGSYAYGDAVWQQRLPQVMINSEYAQQINDRIYAWAEDLRQMIPYSGISYEYDWYIHGDLLTIVIEKINTAYDERYYNTVYTLRLSDGGEATREEILAAAGVSEETFMEKAHPLVANTFGTSFGSETMWEDIQYIKTEEPTPGNTHYQYIFGRTVSRENLQDTVLYLDKDGTLCFQVKIYQFAGADYHEREYRIDDVPEKSQCYELLMEYSVGRAFPIDKYYCYDAFHKALELSETTESEISDLQCFATYYVNGTSFYKICFTLEDVPHTYYYTVGTCEPMYEMT